jgi:hypothetical protein
VSVQAPAPVVDAPEDQGGPTGRSAWMLVICAAAVCIFIALASGTHIGLVLVTVPIVVAIIFQSPKTMLLVLPVWMVMLGLVRRLTPGGGNVTFSGDPVLLIGPIVLLLLFTIAVSRGAFQDRTRFANVVGALGIVAFFEAFNPKQGSLLAGLGGLLFILVPMLAFWVGRQMLDEENAVLIVKIIAVLALLSAIYGLIQQFHGLPPWDKSWITSKGYAALTLGSNVIRAFGPFSSAQEYAAFLSVGLVAWLATARKSTRMFFPLHVAALGTVAVALWFESERTAVFLAVLAIGVMAAAALRLPPYGVLLGGFGAVAALVVLGGHLGSGGGAGTTGALNTHLVKGIQSPFSSSSSLPGHIRATRIGILQAFKNPIGHGTGSVTIASSRYAHSRTVGTEYDPGNMGIAFGVPGLALYVMLAWYAIKTAYRTAVVSRDVVALFGLGVLMVTLFQWTNGDLYSVCWLIWLFLGFLDMKLLRMTRAGLMDPVEVAAPQWRTPGARHLGTDGA